MSARCAREALLGQRRWRCGSGRPGFAGRTARSSGRRGRAQVSLRNWCLDGEPTTCDPHGPGGETSFLPRDPRGPPRPGPTPGSWPGSRARVTQPAAPCPRVRPARTPLAARRCPARVVWFRLLRVRAARADLGARVPRRFGAGTRAPPGRLPLACPATASPQQQLLKGSSWLWASVETRADWIRDSLWAGSFWAVVVVYRVNV